MEYLLCRKGKKNMRTLKIREVGVSAVQERPKKRPVGVAFVQERPHNMRTHHLWGLVE